MGMESESEYIFNYLVRLIMLSGLIYNVWPTVNDLTPMTNQAPVAGGGTFVDWWLWHQLWTLPGLDNPTEAAAPTVTIEFYNA